MTIGDKVRWIPSPQFLKRGWNPFDGYILADCSYFGDGKRQLWGISKSKQDKGYLVVDEKELTTKEINDKK